METELFTRVAMPKPFVSVTPETKMMTLGSCFSQHVGDYLQQRMPEGHVSVNPFGVLYNPVSIAEALKIIVTDDYNVAEKVFCGQDGVWHSWMHSSVASAPTEEACCQKVAEGRAVARCHLRESSLLCVTFGTTRCYRLCGEGGYVVANCHKEPQRIFCEEEPDLDTLYSLWEKTLAMLRSFSPDIHVCFTVSPYRYRKYGYHISQLQKAKLLLLTERIVGENSFTAYFPSYEIMLDELRDYRFYSPDMLHPSQQAVEIIARRFEEWTFSKEMCEYSKKRYKEWKRQQHREIVRVCE